MALVIIFEWRKLIPKSFMRRYNLTSESISTIKLQKPSPMPTKDHKEPLEAQDS